MSFFLNLLTNRGDERSSEDEENARYSIVTVNASVEEEDELSQNMEEMKQQLEELQSQMETVQSRTQVNSSVMHVAEVKMQQFYESDPELWFMIVENQFSVRKITNEKSKYSHVVSNLNCNTAIQVKDIIKSPYIEGQYEKLKHALISIYAEISTEKIRKLISNTGMGHKKPSQMLHYMKSLAGNSISDDFVEKLWIQRLPPTTRAVLLTSNEDLETIAKIADSMWEVTDRFSISNIQNEENAFEKLLKKLDNISNRLTKLEGGGPHGKRSSSKSQTRGTEKKEYDTCWYHYNYGDKANNCRSPCKFVNRYLMNL